MRKTGQILLVLLIAFLNAIVPSCKDRAGKPHAGHTSEKGQYTCPMHPQIIRDKPGQCPICGMNLVKKEENTVEIADITLATLLQPTNEYVISTIPVVAPQYSKEPVEIEGAGYITYNTSSVGIIAARVSGRIEKLYIKYRYQPVSKGQLVMEIYSPEMLTAQENLLFILENDAANESLVNAAKQKLLLLGMSEQQLNKVIATKKAIFTIAVYSNYSGHIHEATKGEEGMQEKNDGGAMNEITNRTTPELNLKEGMYVQAGQVIFSVYDPNKLWGILSVYPSDQSYINVGDMVRITPYTDPQKEFSTTVSYIEPVFRDNSKTVTARVNIDNDDYLLPVGSQVKAVFTGRPHEGLWLPKEAVLSLGINKVVFVKKGNVFAAQKVTVGHIHHTRVQIVNGLTADDSVAINARYLMDSESFIKVNR